MKVTKYYNTASYMHKVQKYNNTNLNIRWHIINYDQSSRSFQNKQIFYFFLQIHLLHHLDPFGLSLSNVHAVTYILKYVCLDAFNCRKPAFSRSCSNWNSIIQFSSKFVLMTILLKQCNKSVAVGSSYTMKTINIVHTVQNYFQ